MTREQLIEYAALDAFGLLDEYESALYTRSFHHAAAGVQDEILELQAELVSDEALLADDAPPPELRERVLRTVSDAIEADARRLQPIARIGRPHAGATPTEKRRMTSAGHFWRASSFVLAASLMVTCYFAVQFFLENERIKNHLIGLEVQDAIVADIGVDLYTEFLASGAKGSTTFLKRSGAPAEATAWVVVRETETGAQRIAVFTKDLDVRQEYTIVLLDRGTGESVAQESFVPAATFWGHEMNTIETVVLASSRWELRSSDGDVLFQSV